MGVVCMNSYVDYGCTDTIFTNLSPRDMPEKYNLKALSGYDPKQLASGLQVRYRPCASGVRAHHRMLSPTSEPSLPWSVARTHAPFSDPLGAGGSRDKQSPHRPTPPSLNNIRREGWDRSGALLYGNDATPCDRA
jgi:hypothetical protein